MTAFGILVGILVAGAFVWAQIGALFDREYPRKRDTKPPSSARP